MLELIEVSKQFGDIQALDGISVAFEPNKTYVLLGTSGCGKTTLLKASLGLVRLDSGEVRIDGKRLEAANVLSLRRRIGYVPQNAGLFPHLTAAQNVTLMARRLRMAGDEINEKVRRFAELTQLPLESLDRYPTQLSGGQRQRVGLIRALMLDPPLLLMDEPLGALDPIIRSDLQKDLRDIFQALDKTVVIVTHDLHEAAFFADEVLLLRAGSVVQRGAIRELIDNPADPFVERFVSSQQSPLAGGSR